MSISAVPKSEKYVDPIDPNIVYPKIAVDDIEICCLHYHSCSDAIEAWERRSTSSGEFIPQKFENARLSINSFMTAMSSRLYTFCNMKIRSINSSGYGLFPSSPL